MPIKKSKMTQVNGHMNQTVHTDEAWSSLYSRLEQEELINTQEAKFNRYCEIVDIFMKILGEEAFKKGIMLDDWLKE